MRRYLPWSGIIHLFSAVLAAIGAIWLIATTPYASTAQIVAAIYGVSLTLLFVFSTLSDITVFHERWVSRWQKVDHAFIFVFIAACYTPLCMFKLTGTYGVVLLTTVWVLAAVGALFKLFVFHAPRWISTGLYLGLGWLAIVAVGPITRGLSWGALTLLFAGAGLYTVGALIYASRRCDFWPGVFGNHEVWHTMVTSASACHFAFIAAFILPGA